MEIDRSRGAAETRSSSRAPSIVIPGLVPGTHDLSVESEIMGGRDKPGHDGTESDKNAASSRLRMPSTKTAQIVEIARSWIGTPYVHQASVKGAGCDCLGLLRGVWRELHGDEPETPPPYAPDWSEATGEETLYMALHRHLREIDKRDIAPGDIALFRMVPSGPAKHCGILANNPHGLTLIHARQNKQVSEEAFSRWWRQRLAFAFRLRQPNIREEGKHEI